MIWCNKKTDFRIYNIIKIAQLILILEIAPPDRDSYLDIISKLRDRRALKFCIQLCEINKNCTEKISSRKCHIRLMLYDASNNCFGKKEIIMARPLVRYCSFTAFMLPSCCLMKSRVMFFQPLGRFVAIFLLLMMLISKVFINRRN